MTDSTLPEGQDDPSAAPEYRQLGEEGNPLSDAPDASGAGLDQTAAATTDDDAENPPLPDWGPTDGTHGVDGADPNA